VTAFTGIFVDTQTGALFGDAGGFTISPLTAAPVAGKCPGALVADVCATRTFATANRKLEFFDRVFSTALRGSLEVLRFFALAFSGCIAFTGEQLGKISLGFDTSPLGGGVTVGCPIFINRIFETAQRATKEIVRVFEISWRIPFIFVLRTFELAWKAGVQIDKVFPVAWSLFDAWIKQDDSEPDTFVDEPDSEPDTWVKQDVSEPDDWST